MYAFKVTFKIKSRLINEPQNPVDVTLIYTVTSLLHHILQSSHPGLVSVSLIGLPSPTLGSLHLDFPLPESVLILPWDFHTEAFLPCDSSGLSNATNYLFWKSIPLKFLSMLKPCIYFNLASTFFDFVVSQICLIIRITWGLGISYKPQSSRKGILVLKKF